MKDDKSTNTIILDNEDVQLMNKEIIEAVQESFKTIEERQEEISGTETDFLKVLCKVVEGIKFVADYSSPTTKS